MKLRRTKQNVQIFWGRPVDFTPRAFHDRSSKHAVLVDRKVWTESCHLRQRVNHRRVPLTARICPDSVTKYTAPCLTNDGIVFRYFVTAPAHDWPIASEGPGCHAAEQFRTHSRSVLYTWHCLYDLTASLAPLRQQPMQRARIPHVCFQ